MQDKYKAFLEALNDQNPLTLPRLKALTSEDFLEPAHGAVDNLESSGCESSCGKDCPPGCAC